MSTVNDTDLLLVERNGIQYQITIDEMSTLNDDDLLLVERGGTQYKIEAQYVSTGPDGLVMPPVEVLTPVNGAGLNEGSAYTPLSSAYVSTDTTPIYTRYFPQTITTISGGSWTDENNAFDGNTETFAVLGGTAYEVSQFVFTNIASLSREGESSINAYAASGGSIEVMDENDAVLRTYSLPTSASSTSIGIVRTDNKIRFTSGSNNDSIYLSRIDIGGGPVAVDSVISGRVAFEFTDDTDLDRMVAPIIMTDENGNIKVPTTSTVDSTTTIPGVNKDNYYAFTGNGNPMDRAAGTPAGDRMAWIKTDAFVTGIITDNVVNYGKALGTDDADVINQGPMLNEYETILPVDSRWNAHQNVNYVAEIGVAPKVLDIVTWSADGDSMREITHNLGTKPGMIIVKATTMTSHFFVWHQHMEEDYVMFLSERTQQEYSAAFVSEPTQSKFYVGGNINMSGHEYVAYIFAASTEDKVFCGEYTGNANSYRHIQTGVTPGFVLIKRTDGNGSWFATMTGMENQYKYWNPDMGQSLQGQYNDFIQFSTNKMILHGNEVNENGAHYIYLAIGANLTGPNSTQLNLLSGQDLEFFTTGTQITSNVAASGSNISFASQLYNPYGETTVWPGVSNSDRWFKAEPQYNEKWLIWIKCLNNSHRHVLFDSERDNYAFLNPSSNSKESKRQSSTYIVPTDDGYGSRFGYSLGPSGYIRSDGNEFVSFNFKAAPQFFDVVKYEGKPLNEEIPHGLGVLPGCIIIKSLGDNSNYIVWHADVGYEKGLFLNRNYNASNLGGTWINVSETGFSFGMYNADYNMINRDYIAYIFAQDQSTIKCGTYAGAGAYTTVDVGFQPRWFLCKSKETNNWGIFDKNVGTGYYLRANTENSRASASWTALSNGIRFNQNIGEACNAGQDYIYIAIADESLGHPPFPPTSTTVTQTPDPNSATMVVNAESFDTGDSASAPPLNASITSIGGTEGNTLYVDASAGTWLPGLYAKGTEITLDAPSPDEITFTSRNAGTVAFSGVDANLSSRTWTLESGASATGPWTVVDTYVDYDAMSSQDGSTPWTSNKPALAANTFYRIKVKYDSTNAESVESVYHTFKTGDS